MFYLTGVLRSDTNRTVGYRFYDMVNSSPSYVLLESLKFFVGNNRVINAHIVNDKVELLDGSINNLPIVSVLTCITKPHDNRMTIVGQQNNNGSESLYYLVDRDNKLHILNTEQVISLEDFYGFVNAKIVTRNNKKFVSALKGSFNHIGGPQKDASFNEVFHSSPDRLFRAIYHASHIITVDSGIRDPQEIQSIMAKRTNFVTNEYPDRYLATMTMTSSTNKRVGLKLGVFLTNGAVSSFKVNLEGERGRFKLAELSLDDLNDFTSKGSEISTFARAFITFVNSLILATDWFTTDNDEDSIKQEIHDHIARFVLIGRETPNKIRANMLIASLLDNVDGIVRAYAGRNR